MYIYFLICSDAFMTPAHAATEETANAYAPRLPPMLTNAMLTECLSHGEAKSFVVSYLTPSVSSYFIIRIHLVFLIFISIFFS